MKEKSKSDGGKDKPKAKKFKLNKETVENLSDDLGVIYGWFIYRVNTAANCSDPCPKTKLLCPHKTKVTGGCPILPKKVE